jgi:hypothetical protein
MTDRVDIWPRCLDGSWIEHVTDPYHLNTDVEIMFRWGESIDRDQGLAAGIPGRFLPEARRVA